MSRSRDVNKNGENKHAQATGYRYRTLLWLGVFVTLFAVLQTQFHLFLQKSKPRLLVISVGGLRHDLLEKLPASDLPFFTRMRKYGAQAEWLVPSLPGPMATAASIFSGRHPNEHGILSDHFMDRRHGELRVGGAEGLSDTDHSWWADVEPIWRTVEKQRGHSFVFNIYGGCTNVSTNYQHRCIAPQNLELDDEVDSGLFRMLEQITNDDKDIVLGVLHTDVIRRRSQEAGSTSDAVFSALRKLDRKLQHFDRLLLERGLRASTDIMIISDGGMTDTADMKPVPVDELIPDNIPTTVTGNGAVCLVYLAEEHEVATVNRTQESEAVTAYRRGYLPELIPLDHPYRGPNVLLLANPGYYLENTVPLAVQAADGYDDTEGGHPESRGVLLARGPHFRAGATVPEVRAVDVYSLMTSVLSLSVSGYKGCMENVATMLQE